MIDSLKTPGTLEYLVGLYAYYLPFILYMVWAPVGIIDLSRRKEISNTSSMVWTFIILFVPVFGGAIYLVFGGSTIEKTIRNTMVYGGIFLLVIFLSLSKILQI